ncbi:general transcription factor IIH subunit 2 [Selaginella moellendorffii]|nr:general transcription factor IIH subunit 2 [Selaginella moellendorffii]|eukprot:XP_002977382.2 general transcription factor IIH subunit 2 [Selaginella moellendorffii]
MEKRSGQGGAAFQEDEEMEEEDKAPDMEAWERAYADDRSWESLIEDESGLLKAGDDVQQQRQHRRRLIQASGPRIQRGIIRYLCLILDFSRAAGEIDFRPSRMAVVAKAVEDFVREYFDQNPLSQLGIIVMKNGIASVVTELSGSPEAHIRALKSNLESFGEASLQNGLELAHTYVQHIPSYGHREVVIVFSALSTCDPGNILETVKKCKAARMKCSVVGLTAEIYICKHISQETGGSYAVAMNEGHLKEILLEHVPPPAAMPDASSASLVRMGFPQRGSEGAVAICACHKELKIGGGYICPRCRARVCELPTECSLCGLALVSSAHLARSYHHLFPIPTFDELLVDASLRGKSSFAGSCFGCRIQLSGSGSLRLRCPRCKRDFCFDCDVYIHESLHNCPGCETLQEEAVT